MFKCLCLLLVAVLSLGNLLRLKEFDSYELPFWLSLTLCLVCFFLIIYHSLKNTVALPKEKRTSLSALKKTDD